MEGQKPITHDTFEGRVNVEDERFRRNKERLDKNESEIDKVAKLTTATTQLIMQHDKKLDKHDESLDRIGKLAEQTSHLVQRHDTMLQKHDERIGRLEERPAKRWDTLIVGIIGAIAVAVVAFLTRGMP